MENGPKTRNGIAHILDALRYSLSGITAALTTETAFRLEIILACLSLPIASLLPLPLGYKAFLIVSTIGVLIVELLNTAIEYLVNMVSQDFSPLGKRAKDMGSAAVMLSIVNLSVAWLFALWQWVARTP